jgi:hypothetical protein
MRAEAVRLRHKGRHKAMASLAMLTTELTGFGLTLVIAASSEKIDKESGYHCAKVFFTLPRNCSRRAGVAWSML